MAVFDDISHHHLTTIEYEGRRYNVTVHTAFDGVEYVGRLWFADEAWEDAGMPDRSQLPGRTVEDVIALGQRLTPDDLVLRYRRALAEKRRYFGLRRVTEDILAKIRFLNQVAISMRAGLLDVDGAAQEIDSTEKQLHDLVAKLREYAGVEDRNGGGRGAGGGPRTGNGGGGAAKGGTGRV
ncbi:MAG TPA: hypothetical protein VKA84_25695 [Gemmatimonadaceae bacterium]|nr:hypothetical protein [Gemmatimonadaceae bacterium]